MKERLYSFIRMRSFRRRFQRIRTFLSAQERKSGLLPAGNRVLVLAPHPDDESIGCGGTLSLLGERGDVVDLVVLTDGAAGTTDKSISREAFVSLRKEEALRAASVLGINGVEFLDQSDSLLHLEQQEAAAKIRIRIEQEKYDVIFCPWPFDGHSDHEATFRVLAGALKSAKKFTGKIWLYEIWNPLLPNRFVDISSQFPKKVRAIECYRSQLADRSYLDAFTALGKYRSLMIPGAQQVEAFVECDRKFLLSMGLK